MEILTYLLTYSEPDSSNEFLFICLIMKSYKAKRIVTEQHHAIAHLCAHCYIALQRLQSPIQFSFRKIAEKPRCVARRSTIKELHYKTVHFFLGKGDRS